MSDMVMTNIDENVMNAECSKAVKRIALVG